MDEAKEMVQYHKERVKVNHSSCPNSTKKTILLYVPEESRERLRERERGGERERGERERGGGSTLTVHVAARGGGKVFWMEVLVGF